MHIKPGHILKATPLLNGSVFENAIIFLTEYNAGGAMGFAVNKLFPRSLNELTEFKDSRNFPLYEGGPVDPEHLFFLHRRPELIEGGSPITNDIYLGGNFRQALSCMNDQLITEDDMKICIGYCGWDYAQLEDEIEEGSWVLQEEGSFPVFTH